MSKARCRTQSISVVYLFTIEVWQLGPLRWSFLARALLQTQHKGASSNFPRPSWCRGVTKLVLLCGGCGCQEVGLYGGGAEVFDAGACGFGGGGVAEVFLGGGELLEDEEGTRVGGQFVDRGGEITLSGEQIATSGFIAVGDEQVARQVCEVFEPARAGL